MGHHRGRGGRVRRVTKAALWGLTAVHLVDTVVLRRRRALVTSLLTPARPPDLGGKVGVIAAPGLEVDDDIVAAAAYEMDLEGFQVLDLVPADLPSERALRLLRRVAPERQAGDVVYAPGGAHEAVALHPQVVARMTEGAGPTPVPTDRAAMVRATVRAQRYAPLRAAVRVAPGLDATPQTPADRWDELEGLTAWGQPYLSLAPAAAAARLVHLAALTAGAVVAPGAAAATALVSWAAQPLLVFRDGPIDPAVDEDDVADELLQPPDLMWDCLLRLPRAWIEAVDTAVAGYRKTLAARLGRTAGNADDDQPQPPEDLFEARRDDCPWCGSTSLRPRLDTTDLFQAKPGAFHLDECKACKQIFQNPALTDAGLSYYYADFYEGLGEEAWEVIFASGLQHNRNRAQAIARIAEPRTWLDVGAGHGHFCLVAKQRWPETRFEAVDMGDSIEEAARRGRVDVAHNGFFADLAPDLPGPYDVVSMHHYLEHTRDPRAELAAATKVLAPGGHLMIELPDPATPWARRLGRFWFYWVQPQHLSFIRCEELVAHLEAEGYEILAVERAGATLGYDLATALLLRLQDTVRSPHLPWLPEPPPGLRAKRIAAIAAIAPAFVAALAVDTIKDASTGSGRLGNAYRIVARGPS